MFYMLQALRKSGLDIHVIDELSDPYSVIFKAKRLFKNIVLKKNYLRDREPLTLNWYARQVERRLAEVNPDIVFSAGAIPVAYLRTDKPIIFWADATFDGMINFYPEYTDLCEETIRNGHSMEQAALSNSRLAIFSSEWAAESAVTNYDVDDKKVKVIPYGANLARLPHANEVMQEITSRDIGVCRLLFVGVDWYRKGGDKALMVATALKQRGYDVELHVVGCDPPSARPVPVKTYGFLSKNNRGDNELLSRLYETSTFFILPSKAECAAVVVAEANAFGLPALTTNVGGMGTVVRNGKNGHMFDSLYFVQECADYIMQSVSSKRRYQELCRSSFDEYIGRLNWDSAIQSVLLLLASEGMLKS